MSTFVKSNTFTNGVDSDANTVNQNFDEIADFLNNQVVHIDGSKSMTGINNLPPIDPTSDNQATRKAYVDRCVTDNVANEANTRAAQDSQLHADIAAEATARNNADISILNYASGNVDDIRKHFNGGTIQVTTDSGGNFTYFYPREMAGGGAGVSIVGQSAALIFVVWTSNSNAFQATMVNPANGQPLGDRTEVIRYTAILS